MIQNRENLINFTKNPLIYHALCVYIAKYHFSIIFCFQCFLLDPDPYHLIVDTDPDSAPPLIRVRIQGNHTVPADPVPQPAQMEL